MKFNCISLIVWLVLLCLPPVSEATAGDTYGLIKSRSMTQTEEVEKGFTQSFEDVRLSVLDMEGKEDAAALKFFLDREKPSVIICLNYLAAQTAVRVEKNIPIIFAMVMNYENYPELKKKNVTGVSMEIPPASLLIQFGILAPEVRSVGLPFHPEASAQIVKAAADAAKKLKIQLVEIPVSDPDQITAELSKYENDYAGLWMLGDRKLYRTETRAFSDIIEFSRKKRKPLLAFSEAFLKAGAFFSVSINYTSLGSQLAMIVRRITKDKVLPSDIPVAPPIGTYTVINKTEAKSLFGKEPDPSIYEKVDKVYPE